MAEVSDLDVLLMSGLPGSLLMLVLMFIGVGCGDVFCLPGIFFAWTRYSRRFRLTQLCVTPEKRNADTAENARDHVSPEVDNALHVFVWRANFFDDLGIVGKVPCHAANL